MPSVDLSFGFPRRYDNDCVPYRVHPPGESSSDDGWGSALDDDGLLVYNDIDDLVREFEAWKAEDEEQKADKETEKKVIQEEAVKNWTEQQIREVEVRRQNIEDERSSLRAELTKQRLTLQQIEDIINPDYGRPEDPRT